MKLATVTATLDPARSEDCRVSWRRQVANPNAVSRYVIVQTAYGGAAQWIEHAPGYVQYSTERILGVVPAFALGVQKALDDGADVIACFHDDLLIEHPGWDQTVLNVFDPQPEFDIRPPVGLIGFGGGRGLGDDQIYQVPYAPMQLARKDFVSNMRDAEVHGRRVTHPVRVACLDGFSQIGTRAFWEGRINGPHQLPLGAPNLFGLMQSWGVIHHFYDGMLGCFAARLGWEVWMLPIACHHFGGRTAVGDARYHAWARLRKTGTTEGACGDAGFWQDAHRIGYTQFRDVLPIRLPEGS